ncbi:hypothetical protein OS493_014790 [Desmophyllum pertusum]|uniref:Uncharacterized protein n=1 Tax=Desmophyllum pertusum TaxID=174260 RepID=A0A9X0CFG3_9CNID|nr:hypothetical protein OS493_014790 [Desmophyllum pertusum]
MAIRWLAVLCAWALLAQYSLSFPEEELLEEFELDEPEVPEEEEVKDRERRQSGCKDVLDYCSQWPDKYCQDYKDYMKTNCPKNAATAVDPLNLQFVQTKASIVVDGKPLVL